MSDANDRSSTPPDSEDPAATEADYEVLSNALMQSQRGRWFLAEYGRRCREADAAGLLDSLARIEYSLAEARDPPEVPALRREVEALGQTVERLAQTVDRLAQTIETTRDEVSATRMAEAPDPARARDEAILELLGRLGERLDAFAAQSAEARPAQAAPAEARESPAKPDPPAEAAPPARIAAMIDAAAGDTPVPSATPGAAEQKAELSFPIEADRSERRAEAARHADAAFAEPPPLRFTATGTETPSRADAAPPAEAAADVPDFAHLLAAAHRAAAATYIDATHIPDGPPAAVFDVETSTAELLSRTVAFGSLDDPSDAPESGREPDRREDETATAEPAAVADADAMVLPTASPACPRAFRIDGVAALGAEDDGIERDLFEQPRVDGPPTEPARDPTQLPVWLIGADGAALDEGAPRSPVAEEADASERNGADAVIAAIDAPQADAPSAFEEAAGSGARPALESPTDDPPAIAALGETSSPDIDEPAFPRAIDEAATPAPEPPAPRARPPAGPFAAVYALSEEERIALFT